MNRNTAWRTTGSATEFDLAHSLVEARTRAGFTQAELAKRMKTTQSVVARLERMTGAAEGRIMTNPDIA